VKRVMIAACAALAFAPAWAESSADFSIIDANLKACLARNGSTPAVDNCNAIATADADRRLNDVYAGPVNALKHPKGRMTRVMIPRSSDAWSPRSAYGSRSGMRTAATRAHTCSAEVVSMGEDAGGKTLTCSHS
jgi:uncharacterized protein YecT (DUF1311 family)